MADAGGGEDQGSYIVVPVSNKAFDDVHIPIKSLPTLDINELYDVLKVTARSDADAVVGHICVAQWCVVLLSMAVAARAVCDVSR
jgi:hypothetical protein